MNSGSLPIRRNGEPVQVIWQWEPHWAVSTVFCVRTCALWCILKCVCSRVCLCGAAALCLAKEVGMKRSSSKGISLTRLPSPTPLIQRSHSEVLNGIQSKANAARNVFLMFILAYVSKSVLWHYNMGRAREDVGASAGCGGWWENTWSMQKPVESVFPANIQIDRGNTG